GQPRLATTTEALRASRFSEQRASCSQVSREHCMYPRRIALSAQLFAKLLLGERFRNRGEQLQMFVRGLRRNQQNQHLADGPVIGCAERYWNLRAQEGGDWTQEAAHAGVWNGNSKGQRSGTDFFALEQTCADVCPEQSMSSSKKACS